MSDLMLINISGEDKPGLSVAISQLLADFSADILDIGQAVIHNHLSLGILTNVPDDSEKLQAQLLVEAEKLDMKLKLTPVAEAEYADWVALQGRPRFILTLLARKIKAVHIARVNTVIAACGLNIDAIIRLSGRVPLQSTKSHIKACVEYTLKGQAENSNAFRAELMQVCTDMDIDIAVQEDSIYRRNRRLIAFDMDSTLITTEVIDELAVLAGAGDEVSRVTELAMLGKLDFQDSLRQRVALLKGLPESSLKEVAARLPLTEGVEELFATLNKLGYKTAILSGGFSYFAAHLQNKLGINYAYANNLEIVDGILTGNVIEPIVDAAKKAELLRKLADLENISMQQTIAVGDGANDLAMLAAAGLGIAFHAKPVVKQNAEQSISTLGLDSILYLMGIRDREAHKLSTD
ncbi:MAG: phosphoserine phosphatase SerB [Pseudomonadales bacterium]|nr:phosphoserine phosphatase SerB [Pseudomonadales bacterium]